mgnify:CR=1 FL=1
MLKFGSEDERADKKFVASTVAQCGRAIQFASDELRADKEVMLAAVKPVADFERRALLFLVETHAGVVIVGHTGCGKTTQIPQYLHEAGWTAEGRVQSHGKRVVRRGEQRRLCISTFGAAQVEPQLDISTRRDGASILREHVQGTAPR